MNNEYLTEAQAANKLGYTGVVAIDFVTKGRCLQMGADTDRLRAYPDTDFPVDDDIVPVVGPEIFVVTTTVLGCKENYSIYAGTVKIYYN